MLKSLYISSFIIIDKMQVDLFEGMSALTGETGAGKSIIIEALGQLCGNRASISLVRKGEEKAIIEGVFDLKKTPDLLNAFKDVNIDFEEETIITKEIFANGKSNIKINYRNTTNNALKIIAPFLIHIHSQFESQTLFSLKNHIHILDDFCHFGESPLMNEYLDVYREYRSLQKKIKTIEEEDFSDERIEYYQAQYKELMNLEYTDEDIETIENEVDMMKNFEKLNEHIQSFDRDLSDSGGAFDHIKSALSSLDYAKSFDEFQEQYDTLYNQYYAMMDTHQNIMHTFSGFSFDEYRFNELQETLYEIHKLKRKYGYSMNDIYKARDDLREKIETSQNREGMLEELHAQEKTLFAQATHLADEIHDERKKSAEAFELKIKEQLNDLYLSHAVFKVDFLDCELNSLGSDSITFKVAMNAGQALTPLNESASGGEISRLMLAIKTISLQNSDVDTIVFDEVDTGVSGKVADAIGEKMSSLANYKQVICITHLPQVAVHAQTHYAIMKESDDHQTYTSIHCVESEERVQEVAKMLSGDSITREALENARSLLNR